LILLETIIKLKEADPDAQRRVFEQYGERFYKLINRYVGDTETAKDIMVDAMLKVFKNASKGRFENAYQFEAWMTRIMINEALTFLRKKGNFNLRLDEVPESYSMAENALSALGAQEILGLIEELPTGYRTVFNLFAVEGYGHKEIAEMLSINVGTSKSQLSHARSLLKKKILRSNERRKSI